MSAFLACYVRTAALVTIAGLLYAAAVRLAPRVVGSQPAAWRRIGLCLLTASLALPFASAISPGLRWEGAPVRAWLDSGIAWTRSADAARGTPAATRDPLAGAAVAQRHALGPRTVAAASTLLALVSLASLLRLVVAMRRVRRTCAALPVVRRSGRLTLRASDQVSAPFAATSLRLADIVVPTECLARPHALHMVLAHEGHHLRAGHLRTAAALAVLDALLPWGCLRAWRRALGDLEEMACDAHVVTARRLDPLDYASCLVALASSRARPAAFLVAPVRPMAAAPAASLRKRLDMLLRPPAPARSRSAALVLVLTALLAASTVAVGLAVAEPSLDAQHAVRVARDTPRGGIDVPANDMVLAALARRVTTTEGRAATRDALLRMPDHAAVLREVLEAHDLPDELIAVVLVESGFQVGVSDGQYRSAGLWQFIPSTARRYGLDVEDTRDERLEPRRSTEAAAALLADLHARYGEWPLALAAYNQGAQAVDKAIARGGTRDVFELERRGLIPDYASRVLAAVLVLRDPSLAM